MSKNGNPFWSSFLKKMLSLYPAFNVLLVIVSVILIVSLTSVFLSVNTVFSVFSLILVFLSASVLLLLANCEFYAIIFTTVYVGAVSIFFIFVLMTINLRFEDTLEYYDEIYADKIFSLFFLLAFSAIFHSVNFIVFGGSRISKSYLTHVYIQSRISLLETARSTTTANKINSKMESHANFVSEPAFLENTISFVDFSIWDKLSMRHESAGDLSVIGSSLYADMQLNFFLITGILLFTMIAAIGFAVRSK